MTHEEQRIIDDMSSRLRDPDLAMLFANTFPSTLDTTVKYFDAEQNLAFIITGVSLGDLRRKTRADLCTSIGYQVR